VISVAFKTFQKTRLGNCIYKTSLLHRPDEHIRYTPSCPPNILQQNCTHDLTIDSHWAPKAYCSKIHLTPFIKVDFQLIFLIPFHIFDIGLLMVKKKHKSH